jgi:hypothetical protein
MQWSPEPNGGFSTADPSRLPGPVVAGEYGPDRVSVSAQRRDPDSLLCWMRMLIERYRECPELAWGDYEVLDTGEPAVLAHRCGIGGGVDGGMVLAVHNLGDADVEPQLMLDGVDGSCVLVDLLADGTTKVADDGHVALSLGPYDCRWLRVVRADDAASVG